MPAKIFLTDEDIRTALTSSEGLLGLAAQKLQISAKTLSRRLTANPALRPKPVTDPVWERAVANDAAIRAACANAGVNPFVIIHESLGWVENEIEEEPQELSAQETRELMLSMRLEDTMMVRVEGSGW